MNLIYLRKVRLNKGGYDAQGYYWGVGEPPYYWETSDCKHSGYVRAGSRDAAKDEVTKIMHYWMDPVRFFR